jgi:hypothetical protein
VDHDRGIVLFQVIRRRQPQFVLGEWWNFWLLILKWGRFYYLVFFAIPFIFAGCTMCRRTTSRILAKTTKGNARI